MLLLEQKIERMGFKPQNYASSKLRIHRCIADSDNAVTISPTGGIAVCEHCTEELAGSIRSDEYDGAVAASWKEECEREPQCETCLFYPECIRLRKCAEDVECFPEQRARRQFLLEMSLKHLYEKRLREEASVQNNE